MKEQWKLFDTWLDVPLYEQMKELIFRTCKKTEKPRILRQIDQTDLFQGKPQKDMEAEYRLFYPGEVLERLGERRELTQRQMRSLGLALYKTKPLQEEQMFVGTQLPDFMRRLKRMTEKEPFFWLCMKGIVEGAGGDSYEQMLAYPYKDLRELLFGLSIFGDDDQLWRKTRTKLNAMLGKERTLSVYENGSVYTWLAGNGCLLSQMKEYRKKDLDALKYLLRLPHVHVLGGNETVKKKLLENGYTVEELSYLNSLLIQAACVTDRICPTSITGEKIAVETCRIFLNSETVYPKQAYELCGELCALHKDFEIRINGNEGILWALSGQVEVKTPEAFQILYPYASSYGRDCFRHWKRFDLSDPKWDVLYTWLSKDQYLDCVNETLTDETDAQKLTKSLEHYQELTGQDYRDRFWKDERYPFTHTFLNLAKAGVLPVVELMEQFLQEYCVEEEGFSEKWRLMAGRLEQYVKGISSCEAFRMLELYVETVGLMDIQGLFSFQEVVKSCFSTEYSYGYRRRDKPDLVRPFLEDQEHQRLFFWIEEYLFEKQTKDYVPFLTDILQNEDTLLWLPEKDAREIYLALQPELEKQVDQILRKRYLTDDEQQKLQQAEAERSRQEKAQEERKKQKRIKKEFTRLIAQNRSMEDFYRKLERFCQNYAEREEKSPLVASYLKSSRTRIEVSSPKDISNLLGLLAELVRSGTMELETLKQCIQKAEVNVCGKESESTSRPLQGS